MPFLLRKIKKNKWYKSNLPLWLGNNDIQADTLCDLKTDNNNLSLYYIDDDKSNLKKVVSAIASTRDSFSIFEYMLIDEKYLCRMNIKISSTIGKTNNQEVDKYWHRDVIDLSGNKLVEVGYVMLQNNSGLTRIMSPIIKNLIIDGIKFGWLKKESINPKLLEKINNVLV